MGALKAAIDVYNINKDDDSLEKVKEAWLRQLKGNATLPNNNELINPTDSLPESKDVRLILPKMEEPTQPVDNPESPSTNNLNPSSINNLVSSKKVVNQTKSNEKKSKFPLWIIWILIAILGITGIGAYLYQTQKRKQPF